MSYPTSIGNAGGTLVELYVLDDKQQLCPIGGQGELVVGGPQVGLGYLNRPDLTDKSFLPNPFTAGKMYRTGDLVRWLPDRTIEFLGRIDFQVKLNGYRIELGEIERCICSCKAVAAAVVLRREDVPGRPFLAAYYTEDPAAKASQAAAAAEAADLESVLREACRKALPFYMVPSVFMRMEEFPLTSSGKVDRKQLPAPAIDDRKNGETQQIPVAKNEARSASLLEQKIMAILSSILGLERVTSLKKEISSQASLRLLLENDTVSKLARALERLTFSSVSADVDSEDTDEPVLPPKSSLIPSDGVDTFAPASAQMRVHLDDLSTNDNRYNVSFSWNLRGPLNTDRLRKSLGRMVARHQSLRMACMLGDNYKYIQRVWSAKEAIDMLCKLPVIQMSSEEDVKAALGQLHKRAFPLGEARPAVEFQLVALSERCFVFAMVIHHSVFDGSSVGVFMKELQLFYSRPEVELPRLFFQYGDYARWEAARLERGEFEKNLEYWVGKLYGSENHVLKLPLDRPRTGSWSDSFEIPFHVPKECTSGIYTIQQKHGATLYMVLSAAFYVLLWQYTQQSDMSLIAAIDERTPEFQDLIGMFVNIAVFRARVRPDHNFLKLLKQVKQVWTEAFEHPCPFDLIVKRLKTRGGVAAPFTQASLNLVSSQAGLRSLKLDDVQGTPISDGVLQLPSKSELEVTVWPDEESGGLSGTFSSPACLFNPSTIERMSRRWLQLLDNIFVKGQTNVNIVDLPQRLPQDDALDYWKQKLRLDPEPSTCGPISQ
eukprot:g24434.t1